MSEIAVECRELHKAFDRETAVRNLSFAVETGSILALLGPSGCGKTTTLRLIAGFEKLDRGQIDVAGRTVSNHRLHIPPEDRRVGMVFQDYAIFPHLSVAQNIAFGLRRGKKAEARTDEMLALVGLEGTGDKMPHELSGGQQQRVALARALAPEPAVLLLDEPFSNLDASLRVQVRSEVRELLKVSNATAIFVTHEQEEALFIGDHVAVMNQGALEQHGAPQKVFHNPATPFVAQFMGQTDTISGMVTESGIETALGLLSRPVNAVNGARVELYIRPDDVQLAPAEQTGNGRIGQCRFVGIANIYTVILADGSEVRSWQSHARRYAVGSEVEVSLRPDHPPIVFYKGQAL